MTKKLSKSIQELSSAIAGLADEERVDAINAVKVAMHEISPHRGEPVDCVLWVKCETVEANDYNPNSVAPPEMKLLEVSILEDGYTQPIVTYDEVDKLTVVDGFHRNRVGKESLDIRARTLGYLPVVKINDSRTDKTDRIASTIRHNRARGKHRVDSMSEIIVELKKRNWSNEKIARELGMDADEILRLSQISGLKEMFADQEFSQAWEADIINEEDRLEISED